MNNLKVGLMLTALTAILVLIGHLVGGTAGAAIAFALAAAMNLGSFWFSDKIVLKMTGAKPVSEREAPGLHEMVERLSLRAGIPKPMVCLVPDPSPNAFATGRSPRQGVVAVNQGLLDLLNRDELEGVVAHELAHIKSRDTLTSAIVATVAGGIMMIADFGRFAALFGGGSSDEDGGSPFAAIAMLFVAPIAAMMIQMGISRAREFEADRLGAEIAGSPDGLANALLKLKRGVAETPGEISPGAAHLCIVSPFAGAAALLNLFSTHPPVEKRVAKLLGRELINQNAA